MVVIGAFILDAVTTALALVLAWYISYFSDGSVERGLGAIVDVWFVWVVAVVLIVTVVAVLVQVMRGGSIALLLGAIGGFLVALAGLQVVGRAGPHPFWPLAFAILDAVTTALALLLAWYISYFADGSVERGLAAVLDLWFIWVAAVVLIGIVVAALARVMRGGSIALLLGGIGGFLVTLAGLQLVVGASPQVFWLLALAAAVIGGLALSGGASVRLLARAFAAGPGA